MRIVVNRKQWVWVSLLCIAYLFVASTSFALDITRVPNPRLTTGGWVTDMAHLLKPATVAQLNQLLTHLEADNGTEIAVVTVPNTLPSPSPKQYATALFNQWHIGKRGQNNGVLILLSQADRRIEIETGKGIAPVLPDAAVKQIIASQMIPRFKQGDYDGGILTGTEAIAQILSHADAPAIAPTEVNPSFVVLWMTFWFSAFFFSGQRIWMALQKLATASHPRLEPNGRSSLNQQPSPGYKERTGHWYILILASFTVVYSLIALGSQFSVFLFAWDPILPYVITLIAGLSTCMFGLAGGYFLASSLNERAEKRYQRRLEMGRFRCQQCFSLMDHLEPNQLPIYLTSYEREEEADGTLTVTGWRCRRCHLKTHPPGVHLQLQRHSRSKFELCSACGNQSVKADPLMVQIEPQWHRSGVGLIVKECQSCHQRQEIEQVLPRLAPERTIFLKMGETSRSAWFSDFTAYCADCGKKLQQHPLKRIPQRSAPAQLSDFIQTSKDAPIAPEHPLHAVIQQLSDPEIVAVSLGSLECVSWQCLDCSKSVHLRLYPTSALWSPQGTGRLCPCPTCREVTAIATVEVLQPATPSRTGLSQTTIQCQCCGYQHVSEAELAYTQPTTRDRGRDDASPDDRTIARFDEAFSEHPFPDTPFPDESFAVNSSSDNDSSWSDSSTNSSSESDWSSTSDSSSWSDSGSSWSGSDFGGGSSDGSGAGGSW